MAYCVNCGVELEPSLTECPLCNTPVINPKELYQTKKTSPYPKAKGQVDVVKRKDLAILTSTVLIATSLSCLLLNLFVFPNSLWSLFIIGACLVLFVLVFPAVIYTKLPIYISLLFDGVAVGFYLYMITFNTASNKWFIRLALPIVALVTILVEIFTLLLRSFPVFFLTTALYFFAEIAFLCVGIELLIAHYLDAPLKLVWSAIVLTVCGVIEVVLLTILSRSRLRDAMRRRLHF
ncbi:DUF6320 domain-containing protein [Parablautia muri]|uniref:Zinc ribbon domain-containing protein n=1 Tax=Parablautia muri TaxID=2320879 RepID=A0A9X5BFN7_9FIRM|nr:DUF6320 domain-containing protein [Parablautia muri]NBJ92834.1 hypothetical protein [Parablautia muri]